MSNNQDYLTISTEISRLSKLGLYGVQIAKILRNDGYQVDLVWQVFSDLSFHAQTNRDAKGNLQLSVSDYPDYRATSRGYQSDHMHTIDWIIPDEGQQLLDLEHEMTIIIPEERDPYVHLDAKTAFDHIFSCWGLPGIKLVYRSGYFDSTKLTEFFGEFCFDDLEHLNQLCLLNPPEPK